MKNKKLFFLELNEFNFDFLKNKSEELNLSNIKKIFNLNHNVFKCDKNIEHFGLDPWTQWVNIHTGKNADTHKLLQIGMSDQLSFKQYWDILAERGYKVGIWGSMNIKNNQNKNNLIFFPDPWNIHEKIKPSFLKLFFKLPQYLLKNFLSLKISKIVNFSFLFLIYLTLSGRLLLLVYKSPVLLINLFKSKFNKYYLYPIFDWINTVVFLSYKKKYKLDVSILFINLVATLQHRIWDDPNRVNENNFSLYILDDILKKIYVSLDHDEKIIICNGLSQEKLKKNHYHYRQIDPQKFFEKIGLQNFIVEQNMTNDGFLFFKNHQDLEFSLKILENVKINNTKLIYFEKSKSSKGFCIFFMISYHDEILENDYIYINDEKFNPFELLKLDAIRTGQHIPITDSLSDIHFNIVDDYNCSIFDNIITYCD